jgi:alpha-amylase/alpha-mannosidase (GH57 family)
MKGYICIHGHFYQPLRENPWLETIEPQASAYPFHDWNERVAEECYARNAASPILGENGGVKEVVNNYSKISFNFGPTLLAWLKTARFDVYRAILQADRESQRRHGGHGSALAQAYGHAILPLADHRDKVTQVRWGIRDFESHFERQPEGMWLPETAVDTETLEVLAAEGVRFTVLAPRQAKAERPLGAGDWQDVSAEGIDPRRPYAVRLPSGRSIAVFFYDGALSQAVAFERLLDNGEAFKDRLLEAFADDGDDPQLVHIATDGETYGHHHRFGDMALAYALRRIESENGIRITNYGEFLATHPPTHEVEIAEGTSWSCAHGVERWRSACGCGTGAHPGWTQAWRTPLRGALDWLNRETGGRYEDRARGFLRDPWAARDAYIGVILDRSPATWRRFLDEQAVGDLNEDDRLAVLRLLELERHALLMYASDGWFFDDPSGIETVQVLRHAARVVELAGEAFSADLEPGFLTRLEAAKSNLPNYGDARRIYERFVRPMALA